MPPVHSPANLSTCTPPMRWRNQAGEDEKAVAMQDILQPLVHKAAVLGLRVNVARTGLCIGDPAELRLMADGQIGIYAPVRRRFLGVFPRRVLLHLGQLGPAASGVIGDAMQRGQHLRVRIVGLTPEHLSSANGPEVYISIWGDAQRLMPFVHAPA